MALRQTLFRETDFMLYGPGEYSMTVEEVAAQIGRVSQVSTSRLLVAEYDGKFAGFLSIVGSPIPRIRHSANIALGVLRETSEGVATS